MINTTAYLINEISDKIIFEGLPDGVTPEKAAETLKKLNIPLKYTLQEMLSGKKGINSGNEDELFSLKAGGCGFLRSLCYEIELTETGRKYLK